MAVFNSERTFDKVKYQFFASILANIISVSHGCILGWLSPFLPLLLSENSPLASGRITVEEASWLGAIICVGGVTGNFCFGLLINWIGSKRTICLLPFPQIGFWLCIIFGNHVEHLYLARIFAGITGGGIFVCIPLFVAEIAEDHIRGTLGSLLLVNSNAGVLTSFIIGTYLNYTTIPYIMIILPIIFLSTFIFLPQTPQFLLKQDKLAEAEASLRYYRNCTDSTKEECQKFKQEFEKLKIIAQKKENDQEKLEFRSFCTPDARKGLLIGICLMAINQFSGCFALINYSANIFKDSGSTIDANLSSIILAAIQILGTYVATILIDRVGRKILLVISSAATSVGLAVMGLYSYLDKHDVNVDLFNWIPVASLSFVIFIASIGILPVPFIVLAEVLPPKIRGIGSTICVTSISLFSFTILKCFPILTNIIELYGCMWIFSTVCALGTIFIVLVVDETKGKCLDIVKTRSMSLY